MHINIKNNKNTQVTTTIRRRNNEDDDNDDDNDNDNVLVGQHDDTEICIRKSIRVKSQFDQIQQQNSGICMHACRYMSNLVAKVY